MCILRLVGNKVSHFLFIFRMRGVVSQAMVMCAVTPEKTEALDPPPGSNIGDRIIFEDYPGEPDAQLNPKRKVCNRTSCFTILSSNLLGVQPRGDIIFSPHFFLACSRKKGTYHTVLNRTCIVSTLSDHQCCTYSSLVCVGGNEKI